MAAAQDVIDRMRRAAAALTAGGVPYAVVGGNAVAEWVGRVDREATRPTRDVDILIRRADLEAAKGALTAAGFIYRHAASIDMFLDGPGAKARSAVHILYAGEKVRADALAPSPDVEAAEPTAAGFRVIGLEALVTMKLTSYRDKDRTHLRDMIEVELIDATWPARFPPPLAERLQALLDDPDG
jgi:hypothetical protein